jgi:phasin family protein
MYPFTQSVNPAVRSHIDAQTAILNELSQTVSRSFQQVFQLNMQLGQALLEDASSTLQQVLSADRPADALSVVASRAQPATDRLRSYQQQLSQLAATTQVDLTRASEQHVQETPRTARALASEVTRVSAEEADESLRQQEETVKNSRDASLQEAQCGANIGPEYVNNLQGEAAGTKPNGEAGPTRNPGNQQGSNGQAGSKAASSPR